MLFDRTRLTLWAGALAAASLLPAQAVAQQVATAQTPLRVLTLEQALQSAARAQPTVRQARAASEAAAGRVEQARSGYLPQITGTASYQRTTANFAPRPGTSPSLQTPTSSSWNTSNYFNLGLTATQLIYDFGQTSGKWNAAEASLDALQSTERTTRNQVLLTVQSSFFQARAQKTLVRVADQTLSNLKRHLDQIEGFVRVGTRPEIDLAQAKTDLANARVQLINAQNGYEVAKAQLNQAMGLATDTNYEVAEDEIAPVQGEDQSTDALLEGALRARPELVSLSKQKRAQELTIRALKGAYGPTIAGSATATEAGVELNNMVANGALAVTLNWPIFQGGLTNGQVHEAQANLRSIDAQLDGLRLQVRLEIDQSRLAVRAAKSSISAAEEARDNAAERLRLAEGRYSSGVGSIIELGDAQVAMTNASAQLIQAQFNLAVARAQLLTALGQR